MASALSLSSTPVKSLVEFIVQDKFGESHPPFRGVKPFIVVKSDDDRPRALVTDELLENRATYYEVAVTCDEQKEANRFAYQYAHELAHFWFTPEEHPFLEICAVAVSLSVLSLCGQRWTDEKRTPAAYAKRFKQYRSSVEDGSRANLGNQVNPALVSTYMVRGSAQARSVVVGDEHIVAASFLASQVLDIYSSWTPLLSLYRFLCTDESGVPMVDFELWRETVDGMDKGKDFADKIISIFEDSFGIRQRRRWRFCPCFD